MLTGIEEVTGEIRKGKALLLAGDETQLARLPQGNWIGGTIPYFMGIKGGVISRDRIFSTELPEEAAIKQISEYSAATIRNITADAAANGFSFIIIPATSDVHIKYAQDAPNFPDIFVTPVLGWISGVHLDDLGKVSPKVFNGKTGKVMEDRAIVMHCSLPKEKMARIGIVNVFEQGKGDVIKFPKEGFSVKTCLVGGKEEHFAAYIRQKKIDTKLPLVADYAGANVNVSIQEVLDDSVNLYAPVFSDIEYMFASPVANYVSHFQSALPADAHAVFSCNCILNFLYSELEGKVTSGMYGPVTFGEVAYQLLNQTLVYLEII
ncbi:MAG: hypothetical protein JW874_09275 [Spirochaetales bacterium]|nr:hypothetical protein [Spirochaetales bacterium]